MKMNSMKKIGIILLGYPLGVSPSIINSAILLAREIEYTQETLFIKRGRVKINFYTDNKTYLTSRELKTGEVILLASGGHGFEFLEETEMIEAKQGPYCGGHDKVRFNGKIAGDTT